MITTTQSNYENNYNAFQLSLPLDLGIKIDPDDERSDYFAQVDQSFRLC